MICVECTKKDNKIIKLFVLGHAESAEYGKDLVCAGVSAIIFGGLNNLKEIEKFSIEKDDDKGLIKIEALRDVNMHDYIVLETIMVQLKTIEESYSKYIKVIEKGC